MKRFGLWTEVFLLLFFGTIIFLPRLGELPYHGEEPRRVICAYELTLADNPFVPTIQGREFLSRPPFQNWLIALVGLIRDDFGHSTGRIPSFLAVLGMVLVIYFYCRSLLSGAIPFLAGVFFLTTLHVLKYGGLAETEMFFTFFLAGSYLLWHEAEIRKRPNAWKWTIAYTLLAFASLTKGFNQAPVYFVAIVGLYMLMNRRVRNLFTWGHLIGVFVFLTIFGIWQAGFTYYAGWDATKTMHMGDVSMRFAQLPFSKKLEHWALYPLEQFAVFLPWSIFLLAFLNRKFRERAGTMPPAVSFCLAAIAITLPSVWIPPGAKTRYYIPMVPCFVILAAYVVEQCRLRLAANADKHDFWSDLWPRMLKIVALTIPVAGILFVVLAVGHFADTVFPVRLFPSLLFLILSLPIACVLWTASRRNSISAVKVGAVALAFFVAAAYNFIYLDVLKTRGNHVGESLAQTLEKLPPDVDLISVGPAYRFSYGVVYYYMLQTGKILPAQREYQALRPGQFFCTEEWFFNQRTPKNVEWIDVIDTSRRKPQEPAKTKQKERVIFGKISESSTSGSN